MIRIVAGELRGRRLSIGRGVRPTTERAREALFSILGERIRDARVLDAAAGSGALGFEALSRGAREVVFVEADRRTARVIEGNSVAVRLSERVRIVVRTVAAFLVLDRPAGFDIVFFDPPWADPVAGELEGLWAAVVVGRYAHRGKGRRRESVAGLARRARGPAIRRDGAVPLPPAGRPRRRAQPRGSR